MTEPGSASDAPAIDAARPGRYKANSRLFFCMPMAETQRLPRADNRLPLVLDAAARLFREKGYATTSMRDIAAAAGMLPG